MAWIAAATIGGSLIGGYFGNSAAKKQAGANKYATDMQMRPYNDARPFITDMYSGGAAGLNNALNMGTYSGAGNPTYAGLNDMQNNALNGQYNFGNSNTTAGNNFMNTSSGFGDNYASLYNNANASNLNSTASDLYNNASNNNMYAGNAADIYNKASGGFYDQEARDLFNKAGQDSLGNAQNYALNNSRGLVDAAMRGANRNLNEVQLTNLNNSASGTGNTNSSRSGVAEAILRRGNAELEADTTATINDNLMGKALSQGNTDLSNQLNALGGMKSGSQAQINAMSGALGDMRFGDQAKFNNMNTGFNAMNTANNNTFNNMMAANAGMATTYGAGLNQVNSGFGAMLGAGGAFQKDLQNQYNDGKANFNDERDFMMDQYGKFNASILNNAPQGPGEIRPNYVDPTMSAINGAMMGGGWGNQFANFMQNSNQPTNQGMSFIQAPAYTGYGYTSGR